MGLTNLIRAVSTPLRQKVVRMAVNMFDSAKTHNVVMFKKTVSDNLSQLMGKMVEADFLPGVMVRVPEERLVKEVADLQIALNYRMDSLAKYFPPSAPRPKDLAPRGSVMAIAKESTSSGVHEGTHLGWERILTNSQKKQWGAAVEKYGQNMFAGEYAFRVHPEVAARNYAPQFESLARVYGTYTARRRAYNESLAFTVQQILSPGMEITAPKGMVREIGRMFHLPNLVRDVSHRFREPALRKLPPRKSLATAIGER